MPQLSRAERRAANRARATARMSDKKPFDYEEYLTRLADRKVSCNPRAVELQRRLEARRARSRQYWEQIKERNAFENANRELAGGLTCDPARRHQRIWRAVHDAEQAQLIDRVYLRQEDRIANAKNARVRGCGAAAKRAGFAG